MTDLSRPDRTAMRVPILGISSAVPFPGGWTTVDIEQPENLRTLAGIDDPETVVAVVPLRQPEARFELAALIEVGTLARLINRIELPGGKVRVVLEGLGRAELFDLGIDAGLLWASVREPDAGPTSQLDTPEGRAALRGLLERLDSLAGDSPGYTEELVGQALLLRDDAGRCTDLIAAAIPLRYQDRIDLLIEASPFRRVGLLTRLLDHQLVRMQTKSALDDKVEQRIRREYLQERLEVLRDELDLPDPHAEEALVMEARIDRARLSPQACRVALREVAHFHRAAPSSPEVARIRNYVDWLLVLPWPDTQSAKRAADDERYDRVARALVESHVGLGDVKERIGEFLAVRQLGGGARGTVLCFLGPPGTGKSSLGRAVAAALDRHFLTIPVGAMVHEREIVGLSHRQEAGAPGAILTGIHRCGTRNPVILLDEIDKLSLGAEGTSAGALMQLLDPEQNAEFFDHYLGAPFDLSSCLFLATAQDAEEIPDALLDRMEIIEFCGYTDAEKLTIARDHLLPRAREHAGVSSKQFKLSPAALRALIRRYSEEAGVRQLQRRLIALARKAAVRVVRSDGVLSVKKDDLIELIGPRTADEDLRLKTPAVGVATGLAWTSAGGALLPIESMAMPGSGRMILTGQVGEILRESVQTAVSYVRARFERLGIEQDVLENVDLHMHFPSAATPKDGPSAGIAIATALLSLLTERRSRHDVAMTGEVSLLGTVLPVGGVREKLLAAIRTGIKEVIVPARNAEEIMRLPPDIRSPLTIHLIDDVEEAFDLALLKPHARRTRGAEAPSQHRRRAAKRGGRKSGRGGGRSAG